MADSSNTRLDARIEAAAKAAYEWDADKLTCPPWDEYDEGAKGWYREIVTVALAAADAVERPDVERLRQALSEIETECRAGLRHSMARYEAAGAVLAIQAVTRRALAEFESQPTTAKGGRDDGV